MFDWFFEFLYGITVGLLRIIDAILECANKLCGIEDITVDGQSTDLLTLLLGSNEIGFAFRIAVILGLILLVFFGIFAIIRAVVKEKSEQTPAQVAVKIAKTVLLFLFVPTIMYLLTEVTSLFMRALYQATSNGQTTLGQYLFSAFADGAYKNNCGPEDALLESFHYWNPLHVWAIVDLVSFNYIYSWIASAALVVCLAISMFIFVDRAISIVILFIAAPFSMASSVLDDGARFKLWRDQILVKYLTGYGVIISLNIYALIVGIICRGDVEFFSNSFVNGIFKIVIIVGGAYGMQKFTAVIGNLISAGAGSQEVRDNMAAAMGAGSMLGSMAKSPFSLARAGYNLNMDRKHFGMGSAIGMRLGFKQERDYNRYKMEQNLAGDGSSKNANANQPSGAQNSNKPNYGNNNQNGVNAALEGNNNNNNNNNNSNQNNNNPPGNGANLVNNAIAGNDDFEEDLK